LYDYLASNEVIVRNRSKDVHCENCLRITIGTKRENEILINLLKKYSQ
jgi:histidinol-phosphate aminotransferase